MRTLYRLLILSTLILVRQAIAAPIETPVQLLPLSAPLNQARAEISGMTWCGDSLILMPQYPRRLNKQKQSNFFILEKQAILSYLDKPTSKVLPLKLLRVKENKLRSKMFSFDGFEAIVCDGNTVWLSIEAISGFGKYYSYLVPGIIDWQADTPTLSLQTKQGWNIPSQSNKPNSGDETLVLKGADVISIHEVNDPRKVSNPVANVINAQTLKKRTMPFVHLPFRITDATTVDHQHRFWAINYKYSGDRFSRQADDFIAQQYGQGKSHQRYYNVERLIEFEIHQGAIRLVEQAPIQLQMEHVEGRNWEAIARLDNQGLLIATDKFPKTLFGFVPYTTINNEQPANNELPADDE